MRETTRKVVRKRRMGRFVLWDFIEIFEVSIPVLNRNPDKRVLVPLSYCQRGTW